MDMTTLEYLTKEKYKELTDELDQLKKVRRREIAEDLEYAKSLGDLSENAEYQEAREMQAEVEERISKLEGMLKNATIVSIKVLNSCECYCSNLYQFSTILFCIMFPKVGFMEFPTCLAIFFSKN